MKYNFKLIFIGLMVLTVFTQCKDSITDNNLESNIDSNVSENSAVDVSSTDSLAQAANTLPFPSDGADKTSTNLIFHWDEISGASEYVYQLTDNSQFTSTIHKTTVSGNSYKPDMLVPRKRYYWRVRAAGDNTDWSDTWTFTTGTSDEESSWEPPSGSTSSTVTLISPVHDADKVSTNLTFNWKKVDGHNEYVYQLTDNSQFSSTIHTTTVSGTSYKPDMLTSRKRYYWRVKVAGSDEWSDARTFTTGAGENGNQGLPDGYDGGSNDDGNNDTGSGEYPDWQKGADYVEGDIVHYEGKLYICVHQNPGYDPIISDWFWDEYDGGSNDGNTDDSKNDAPASTEVSLISPVDDADKVSTDLNFEWTKVDGQNEYVYQLTDNSRFTSTIHRTTVSGTSYRPDMLVPRKRYYWRVKVAGSDQWSDARTFTTGAGENGNQGLPDGYDGGSNDDGNNDTGSGDYPDWQKGTDYVEGDIVRYESKLYICVHPNPGYDPIISDWFWDEYNGGGSDGGSNDGDSGGSNDDNGDVTPPYTPPPSLSGFVTVQNGNFMLDGEVFRFAGTNAYYLPNYEKLNSGVVDRAFDLFQDTGVKVVRMWAFYDGYDCGYSRQDASENVIQTAPGEYSESALRDLDRVIAKGKEKGIRFIMPFINYWDQLGGLCQYNTWAGASNPSQNMDFFMNNEKTQKWFKDYISMLLNRTNTVTGVKYKDEPAILGWQIMNEGRNSGQDPKILRDWYRKIAQYIKSIDPNHLLSTGEEGFDEGTPSEYSESEYSNTYTLRAQEGTSYVLNTAIPEIDFGSAHWYPADYGFGHNMSSTLLQAQEAWISDHQKIAESYGKPFYLGEFGIAGWGDDRVSSMYDALYQHAKSEKLDGTLLWQLTADGTKCYEFGGNICYPGGRNDSALYNSFKNFVQSMSASK